MKYLYTLQTLMNAMTEVDVNKFVKIYQELFGVLVRKDTVYKLMQQSVQVIVYNSYLLLSIIQWNLCITVTFRPGFYILVATIKKTCIR